MSKIDTDLAAALKRAKSKQQHFVLVEKKPGEGTLIVSRDKIPDGEIKKAKDQIGATKVYKGKVSGKDDQLVFETANDPPPTMTATLKSVMKRDAGLTPKFEARKSAVALGEEDMTDDEIAAANKAAADKAAAKDKVSKRLKALSPHITRALTRPGSDVNKIKTQLVKVKQLIDSGDFPGAHTAIDVLEDLTIKAAPDDFSDPFWCYTRGMVDGRVGKPESRQRIQPEEKECLAKYDEGFSDGRARGPFPEPARMGPNTMTKAQEEEGRRIEEAHQELNRVLRGEGHDHMPHAEMEQTSGGTKVVTPPRVPRITPRMPGR